MARTEAPPAAPAPTTWAPDQTIRVLDGELTFEEFLAQYGDGPRGYEWVNGRVIVLPVPTLPHQTILAFLSMVLGMFCEIHDLGIVLPAGYLMKMGPEGGGTARDPDVQFISNARRERALHSHLDGGADLVVEVLSPGTATQDRREKHAEYEAAGVTEYWQINPMRQSARFFRLGADGRYTEVVPEAGVVRSEAVPGFWLRVDWLWQDPPPKTLDVLHELGAL
jgi:Uma2 family endonuclease